MNPSLLEQIRMQEANSGGEISLACRELPSGKPILYNADRKVKTASVVKFPILVHVAMSVTEGSLSWEMPLTLTEEEKVGGSGVLTALRAGLKLTLWDTCVLMTIVSDNTATNMVIEALGAEVINRRMRDLGLEQTTLFRKAYSPDTPASLEYGLGVTTPNEMLHLLTLVSENGIADASARSAILEIMEKQNYRDMLPRFLPTDWHYAGKTGGLDQVRNDVGIMTDPQGRRYALALFCQKIPKVLWTPENPGLLALANLSPLLIEALATQRQENS